jgi:hypothetical protein
VARWVEGLAPVPTHVFLRCVDYLLDHSPLAPKAAAESEIPH